MLNTIVLFVILTAVFIGTPLVAQQNGEDPAVNSNWLDRIVPSPQADNLDLELEKANALVSIAEQKVTLANMVEELAQQNYLKGMASNLETKKAEIDLAEAKIKLALAVKLKEEIVEQQNKRSLNSKHSKRVVGDTIQDDVNDEEIAKKSPNDVLSELKVNDDDQDLALQLMKLELLINEAEARATQSRLEFSAIEPLRGKTVSELDFKTAEINLGKQMKRLEQLIAIRDEIANRKEKRDPLLDATNKEKSQALLNNAGLQKSDLDDCPMHVVGIYSPQANNRDSTNEVFVTVKGLDKPSIIVVSAYSSTFWRIRFEQPENIKLVIVTGYYTQRTSIDSTSIKIPLIVSSYFNETSTPTPNHPWGYATSWKSEQGWRLAKMLYELTGRTASTFIGMDQARTITIDGKKGSLSVRDAKEPIPGLLTEQEIKENPIPFETDEWNVNRPSADRETENLEDVEQSLKQLILETESKVKSSKSELDELEKEIEELLRNLTDATALDRTKAKALFNKRFELQFENQNLRGELANLKLKLVASQQMKRLQNRDSIIEKEIEEALEKRKTQKSKN